MAKKEESKILSGLIVVLIAFLVSVGVTAFMKDEAELQNTKVVFFDAQAITKAYFDVVVAKDFSNAEEAELYGRFKAEEYAVSLMNAIEEYEKQGYIVLSRSQVFGGSKNSDVTLDIAKKVGVNINYIPSSAKDKLIEKFKERNF